MKFSVVIPAYNAEKYIQEAIDSVLRQTGQDFEVICVDDGSTDGTPSIIESYAHNVSNVIALHEENKGPLLARRYGLKSASGKYAICLDADDCLRNDALEIIGRAIDETGADIVSFLHSNTPDFIRSTSVRNILPPGLYAGESYNEVKRCLSRGRFNTLWNKAIRLDKFDLSKSYARYNGLKHGEDWFQLIPVIDTCKSLCELPDVLYYYRRTDSSGTASFKPSQVRDIAIVHKRFLTYAKAWGHDCYRLACGGEVLQYINLLKISELSPVAENQKKDNFNIIMSTMGREGTFERAKHASLRPDNWIITQALRMDNRPLAKSVIKAVEEFK
jgi:glycosyltransferase involved in cell wall biosynthesis